MWVKQQDGTFIQEWKDFNPKKKQYVFVVFPKSNRVRVFNTETKAINYIKTLAPNECVKMLLREVE